MSDSENEDQEIDKEQLRRIEENDKKVDKKEKRRKRLANQDIVESESGSEVDDEDGSGEDEDGKKKELKVEEHAPLKKTNEQIKKSQFLGEKYGHYKIGTYMRIEV